MPDLATALAVRFEAHIGSGCIAPGARLPTHWAPALENRVAVNTATRAMRLLTARGLAVGEVGCGSFVRVQVDGAAAAFRPEPAVAGVIDLSRNTMNFDAATTQIWSVTSLLSLGMRYVFPVTSARYCQRISPF